MIKVNTLSKSSPVLLVDRLNEIESKGFAIISVVADDRQYEIISRNKGQSNDT